MPVAACPNAEVLAAFACGDMPPDRLVEVADHIVGCEACGGALRAVPEDSLAGLVRDAAASPNSLHTVRATQPPALPGEPTAPSDDVPAGFADHPRYRILRKLGAGGMGTVYKAEDLWMGRVIAIKVVSPHLTAKASAVERFRKEVRVAAQLNDPRMIIAHDTGEAGGCQFLVMELVDGFSLDRLVARRGPLAVPMACAFARHAALGLQHAAEKGMVHRDIKTQNLMVTRKGQIKILDFGLARFAHAEAEQDDPGRARVPFGAGKSLKGAGLTNPNMLMGTPDYLSPEQARNSHDVDHRSDIYSLGCTLYFLLTGRPPFAAAETLIDKLLAHTHEEPPSPCDERPEIPEELNAVLRRMMAKDPDDRYQTAAEVAADLLPFTKFDAAKEPAFEVVEAVLAPNPQSVTPLPAQRPTAFDTAPAGQQPTLSDAPRPKRPRKKKKASWWKRRRGAVIRGAVAAALLIAGIAGANVARKKLPDLLPDGPSWAKAAPGGTTPVDAKSEKGDKTDKGDKAEKDDKPKGEKGLPAAPVVIAPPSKGVQVLFVLPSDGVWVDEFVEVRDRLVSKGATVVTASTAGGSSKPAQPRFAPPVPIDVALRPDMDLSDYAAVLFCGERVDEYMYAGRGSPAAGKVIHRALAAGKPVGGVGAGQAVLAAHGALKGRRAAECRHAVLKYPFIPWDKMNVTWEKSGAVADDRVVTAGGAGDAAPFADAVLKLTDGK